MAHARAVLRAYLALTKPQIVELLLVTTVPALMLAAGGWPDLPTLAVVLLGGALAGGAASALNCYIDRDIDEIMRRTSSSLGQSNAARSGVMASPTRRRLRAARPVAWVMRSTGFAPSPSVKAP